MKPKCVEGLLYLSCVPFWGWETSIFKTERRTLCVAAHAASFIFYTGFHQSRDSAKIMYDKIQEEIHPVTKAN